MGDGIQDTIVVGFDGRSPSEHALEQAIEDAAATHARVVAVVVEVYIEGLVGAGLDGWGYVPSILSDGPVDLQPLLDYVRGRLADAGVEGDAVWGLGDPSSEILRVAREEHARRIVLGHHHHSRLGRFLGTDVAARVSEAAGCDVVVTS